MIEIIFLAFRDAMKQKKMLALVLLALTIGMCNAAITTGVLRGFERYVTEDLVEILGSHVMVYPPVGQEYIPNAQSLIDKAEGLQDVETVFKRSYFIVELSIPGKSLSIISQHIPTEIDAVDPDKEGQTAIAEKIVEGRWLDGETGELVIGKMSADLYGLEVGDIVDVNFRNGVQKRMRIKGVVKTGASALDSMLLMNLEDSYQILGGTDRYNYISIKLFDREKADAVKSELMSEGVRGEIITWDEALGFAKNILDTFTLLLFFISGIAILTASLSVAVLMYINVLNKTREIGTLKAIGASKKEIMLLFLLEACIIAVAGIIVGNGIAFAIVSFLSQNPIVLSEATIRFAVDYNVLLYSSIVAVVAIIISALYPAYLASKLEVIEAMRYE